MYQSFENLTVGEVPYEVAKEVLVREHYSHKWNTSFGKKNVGVYLAGELKGIASYGHAMNPKGWGGITDSSSERCLELNRLWISDDLKSNSETWLMAKSFKVLREDGIELVQSFADGRLGVGTIYQAANFDYYGYTQTLFHRDATGQTHHDVPFTNTARLKGMVARNLLFATGQITETFQVRTYRYLLPLTKQARKKVKLEKQPYPKERAGEIVIEGYLPPVKQVARAYLGAKLLKDSSSEAALKNYLQGNYESTEVQEALDVASTNKYLQGT